MLLNACSQWLSVQQAEELQPVLLYNLAEQHASHMQAKLCQHKQLPTGCREPGRPVHMLNKDEKAQLLKVMHALW